MAAEVTAVGGMLDLTERRLLKDPRQLFRDLADDPSLLGLGPVRGDAPTRDRTRG